MKIISFSAFDHVVCLDLGHEIVSLLSEHHCVLVRSESGDGIDLGHDLLVGSLLGKAFKQLDLSISLQLNGLSDHWSNLLLGLGNGSLPVRISLGDGLSSISLSLLDDLGFDQFGFSNDFVILKIGLSIDLVDESSGLSLPLRLDS